jgi:hypothetical protein
MADKAPDPKVDLDNHLHLKQDSVGKPEYAVPRVRSASAGVPR